MSQAVTRVAKNTFYLYAKMGITMFVSLYTTRLVLNALGAEDFGIFSIVGGAIAMLGFLNAAMASATQRFMSFSEGEGDKEKQKKIFNISFVLHLGIGLAMGFILLLAGWFFFHGILNIPPHRVAAAQVVYGSLIISTVFTVMSVPYEAVLNARENMLYYSLVGILEAFLKLGVAFVVVWTAGDKLIWYGVLMAGIPLITLTIMRIYCHKTYEECTIAPQTYWDKGLLVEMRKFAGWKFLVITTSMLSQYGFGIILNRFFGALLNTALGIAFQTSGQLMVFSNTLMKVVAPIITKNASKSNKNSFVKSTIISSRIAILFFCIICIPFLIETDLILSYWLKNVPEWTVIFCQLQIIRLLIDQFTNTLGISISALGEIEKHSVFYAILTILPIPITYLFYDFGFPPYFMFISWIIINILIGILNLYFTIKFNILKCKDYISDLFMPFLIAISAALIVGIFVRNNLNDSIFRLGLIFLISNLTLITIFFMFSKQELIILKSELEKIKNRF